MSLWYGTRRWRAGASRRYVVAAVALAVAFAPVAVGRSVWFVAVLLVFAGGAYAAVNVVVYELLDRVAPEGAATEAFTWLTAANALGIAVGAVLAGWLAGPARSGGRWRCPAWAPGWLRWPPWPGRGR